MTVRPLPCDRRHPLGDALTSRLFATAAEYLAGEDGCHDMDHVRRVYNTALYLGDQTGGRLDIIAAAAILHDIGRPAETAARGTVCHAERGAAMAGEILVALGFVQADIEAIRHCIAAHRYRRSIPPRTIEAMVLYDADKLDAIGATGVGRAFHFAGQIGARLHNPEVDIAATEAYSREDTAFREYMLKLRHIKDRMLTEPGRRLAWERHRFMEGFFDRLQAETLGEWRMGRHNETRR